MYKLVRLKLYLDNYRRQTYSKLDERYFVVCFFSQDNATKTSVGKNLTAWSAFESEGGQIKRSSVLNRARYVISLTITQLVAFVSQTKSKYLVNTTLSPKAYPTIHLLNLFRHDMSVKMAVRE